jgi:hypothetical protein
MILPHAPRSMKNVIEVIRAQVARLPVESTGPRDSSRLRRSNVIPSPPGAFIMKWLLLLTNERKTLKFDSKRSAGNAG